MSATSYLPTNREWFRRLLSGHPHQVIGGPDNPYLRRWYLIPRNPLINVYLHQFLRSDDDRALHDHPWWFVSLILRGGYYEHTKTGVRWRGAPSLAYRAATHRHRVELPGGPEGSGRENDEQPAWTVIVTGRRTRSWGFWCKRLVPWSDTARGAYTREVEQFVPWKDFGDAGCGEVTK
ncbi:hypothetical protein SEA_JUJU_54 [Gordonia phage JuJu]|uniref:Uncharacterized protein n=1 Tax=Gordonia phage JuJu TaxID=2590929 RepID=A0A516KR51_9CAUD|nr:cysteine dioxygenase [Gordonia phage JuJu]QDP44170.1 hypothetical protein SEA_JUJU_54 [Gordonia phage JuJu]